MIKEKELCDCGKVAIWLYMPGYSGGGNSFSCDDCVPRGCTCNQRYVESRGMPTLEDLPIKWIEEGKIWCHVDEKGREYPCCEYEYEEDGFDKEIEDGNERTEN